MTTVVMAVLIALGIGGAAAALGRLRRRDVDRPGAIERALPWLIVAAAVGGLAYRMAVEYQSWAPLHSHADGVLIIVALLAGIVGYMQWVGRLRGMDLFGLPMIAVLASWGLCASWWTFDQSQFSIRTVWSGLHITAVYFGLASVAMTAISGLLYLFVQRQLKRRDDPAGRIRLLGRTASLEAIDRWMIGWATVAFVMLTVIGVVGGIDASTGQTTLGEAWWRSPKVVAAAAGWLIFAALCHVRFAPRMRGRRAALLSVAGFAMTVAVLAMAMTGNDERAGDVREQSHYIDTGGNDPQEP